MYINSRIFNPRGFAEYTHVASKLGKTDKEINNLVRGTSEKRKTLLCILADRYNVQNFYKKYEEQESPDFVINIFKMLKRPVKKQFEIISRVHGSIENIKNIFEQTGNKSKLLDFAVQINKITGTEGRPEMITEILKSPYRNEYMKNFSRYQLYFSLKKADADAIKNLDKMMENGTFDIRKYKEEYKELAVKKKLPFPKTENYNAEIILKNYNDEGFKLLKEMAGTIHIPEATMKKGGDKILSDIYRSTSKDNFEIRTNIYDKFGNTLNFSKQQELELFELKKMYDAIDNNKHAKNFIKKYLDNPFHLNSLKPLNDALYNVSNKKLDIFADNALNIIRTTKEEERIPTLLNEIENPFFETRETKAHRRLEEEYGYRKKKSSFSILKTRIKNYFNVLQDKMTGDNDPILKEPENIFAPAAVKPQAKIQPEMPIDTQPKSQPELIPQEQQVPHIEPKPEIKSSKETVIDNIMEIIKGKLGVKTLEHQRADYSKGATKMRLKMLPEIFSSITETRRTDRLAGKKHINSENKDALTLFMMINSNNKKYVNYLLKKRNTDGTRMFEVKDIIHTIQKAEEKIKQNKLSNPEYRARDTRRYYNHLYEAKIQQYGKVSPKRKNMV